ncbi:inactive peptidyl-prolyl cis-trans isomerase FKBP6 isoform X1 [Octopus bimaculoides]|uniref:inactive peptidyl-prolyl cis-trans isomerase FKBP6 isoform X1 n=1 Tax=Octopus bimaculoides TaxID=37653 RepID=UPI0022E63563|nr:inactive peptidyl-prolyl cis-trans isomerase FKBP6 isoform X1 [Octopus bimaculoides]
MVGSNPRTIRCVVVGDGAVGKTSMLLNYTTKGYSADYVPTFYDSFNVSLSCEEETYKMNLVDTSGQGPSSECNMNKINLEELTSDTGLLFEVDKGENTYAAEDNITEDTFNLVYSRLDTEIACLNFDQLMKTMQDISGSGGVFKETKHPGYGPGITENSVVEVHYAGFFEYRDEPFDSSRLRDETFKYRVGSGKAIPGWEIALLTMKKGEISWFLIQPEYGFQETGCPPRVPRNATALFEIEILSISDHVNVGDFFLMSEEERYAVTFESICQLVGTYKQEGYTFFKQNHFQKAVQKYNKALHKLGDFSEALRNLAKAHKLLPKDQVILEEIQKIKSDREKFQLVESYMYQKMFSTLAKDQPIQYQKTKKTQPNEEEVSEEFCKSTKDYIRDFLEDKDLADCSMPAFNLTEAEMQFLLKTIDDKGLRILQTDSGECPNIKIVKPDRITIKENQTLLL